MTTSSNTAESRRKSTPLSKGQTPIEDWEFRGVAVLDTSRFLREAFEFGNQESRFSPVSAVLSHNVARYRLIESSEDSNKCFVISPYTFQNRLHAALIRDTGVREDLEASTLNHPLAEPAESVFLDVTDESGVNSPVWKLRGGVDGSALRWLTQVITSGQAKVRIVANVPLLLETLPHDAALRLFLKEIEQLYGTGIASPISPSSPPSNLVSPGCWCITGEDSAWETIQRDSAKARTGIISHFPGDTAMLFGGKLTDRLLIRGDGIELLVVANVDITTLRTLTRKGVRVIAPKISQDGKHCDSPCILIDNDVLWLVGSRLQSGRGRPFLRFKGVETVRLLVGYFGLDYLHGIPASPLTPCLLS